jgi:hypothetical protein
MNVWQFAADNPVTAVIFALIAATCFKTIFWAFGRYLRSRNIASMGWPPEHLDADGDFKKPIE